MKTIEPVRFQSSLLERQEIKNTLHDQISKIRESCSFALELDIDAMIEANEPVGWELPQGFLEHVELSQLESSWEKTISRKQKQQLQYDNFLNDLKVQTDPNASSKLQASTADRTSHDEKVLRKS